MRNRKYFFFLPRASGKMMATRAEIVWVLWRYNICLYIHIHTHTYIYIYVCVCVCVVAGIPAFLRARPDWRDPTDATHTHIYIYVCVYVYINIYIIDQRAGRERKKREKKRAGRERKRERGRRFQQRDAPLIYSLNIFIFYSYFQAYVPGCFIFLY